MKFNLISKFQQGGVYSPPYAVFQALPRATTATRATAASSKSADLTDKDLLEMLGKLDGLPSDTTVIANSLQNFYIDSASPIGRLNSSTSNIAVRYLSIWKKITDAKFSKEEYDSAYKQVSGNGGINEFAISDRGLFVCRNAENDFQFMSAEQLKDSDGSYQPLTNSELLYYRAHDPSLAFSNAILSVVKNGIGIEGVTKMIKDSIANLGASETTEEGFISTQKGRIIQGLQDFGNAVQEATGTHYDGTVNDLYKYKFLTKSQADQANEALAYIYNTLPENAKALLKSKSDLTDEGAIKLVQKLVTSSLDSTQHFELDLEGGVSSKSSKSSTSSGSKDDTGLKDSQLIEMVKAVGGVKQPMTVDRGDGIQMTVFGRQFNLITDMDGDPIGDTSLAEMLSQSGIQGIVKDMQNITFGDQKIPVEALRNITYNNTGVMRVNLPINADGSVNLSLLEAYQKAEADLDALGREPTAEELEEAYLSAGLASLLKADGSLDEAKFGAFLVTEGYTTDELSGVKQSEFVKEYKGDTDRAIQIIQQCLKVGEGKDTTVPEIDKWQWYNPADWFGNYDKIYKAAIYIPIDNGIVSAARLDKQKLDYDEASELERKYQNFEKQARMRSTSVDSLGLTK